MYKYPMLHCKTVYICNTLLIMGLNLYKNLTDGVSNFLVV